MAEMILPGTYIEVRAEGLIAPGPISIGNVGIVGTARRGKIANTADPTTVYTPSNLGEAREIFGQYDAYDNPEEPNHELTLIRALELAYANGASRVFVARVADESAASAAYTFPAGDGTNVTITAVAPGNGYNGATLTTGAYAPNIGMRVADGNIAIESLGNLPTNPADFIDRINDDSLRFTAANNGGDDDIAIGAAVARTTDGVDPTAAVFSVTAGTGTIAFTARQPGIAMNSASITIADGSDPANNCNVTLNDGAGTVESHEDVPRIFANFIAALAGSALFIVADVDADADVGNQNVAVPGTAGTAGTAAVFEITAGSGTVDLTARNPGIAANDWDISIHGYFDVTFTLAASVETWREAPTYPTGFAQVINGNHPTYNFSSLASNGGGSSLFTAAAGVATGNLQAGQEATQTGNGTNGANAGPDDYGRGLAALENEDVHIVVLAGQDTSDLLITHVENASGDLMKRERIGVIGSNPSGRRTDLVAASQDSGRIVFVGPGVKVYDAVANRELTLPGTYTAAAVAGRIASLDPHASPTNKTINARGLQTVFNGTELEQLVLGRVCVLESRNGSIRIVRGITSSTNTAWAQVTTRRIVDYARFGVRAAADPFIGKLNNERVRQALKGSVNSLLADMIDREMLISYELDVSATRPQQIRGIVQVTMVLRPTFSIDYIRVIMYLE